VTHVTKRSERGKAAKNPGLLRDVRAKLGQHRLTIFAAGVAFFAFIAFIPALAAAVSITGLVTDTDVLVEEAQAALRNSPEPTRIFVVDQIRSLADGDATGAGIAATVGILLSVFTASGAISHLMEALNVVFDRRENRRFIAKRSLAVGLLIGAIALIATMVFAMSVLPAQIENWIDASWMRLLVEIGRFALLSIVLVFALSTLYRVGPASHPERERELVSGGVAPVISRGAIAGAVLLVVLSRGFGVFVNNFASYGETYGTLATIVVVMLWLQLMALAILLGAEVDAHLERRRVVEARFAIGLM
jgi:membrane protein